MDDNTADDEGLFYYEIEGLPELPPASETASYHSATKVCFSTNPMLVRLLPPASC